MDHRCCTRPVALSFLLRLLQPGYVSQDFLVDEFDLLAGEGGDDVGEVLDGLGLDGVVFGLDLLHEGLADVIGSLQVFLEVDLALDDELGDALGGHLHVVGVVVPHLIHQLLYLLLA